MLGSAEVTDGARFPLMLELQTMIRALSVGDSAQPQWRLRSFHPCPRTLTLKVNDPQCKPHLLSVKLFHVERIVMFVD